LILEVNDLCVDYVSPQGIARAVDSVNFSLDAGEFLSIVGESGCGKSTLLFAIAQLLSPPAELVSGSVIFKGENLVTLDKSSLRAVRWRGFSVVMQSAMNALNPVLTIRAQFVDVMHAHGQKNDEECDKRFAEVLRLVGIDAVHLRSYAHQLSGGMRQRVMIAMALLLSPDLIIMDEPTSALDVVAQRSLMVQIKELQEKLGFAVIFVTHDISLVSNFSDKLIVMYAGSMVEEGPTREIFGHPLHPYTQGLLSAFPSIRGPKVRLTGIPGSPPSLTLLPTGCPFHPRCAYAMELCSTVRPPVTTVDDVKVRCLLFENAEVHIGSD
jgi:peptide/nickel transport system ATP-binding protein